MKPGYAVTCAIISTSLACLATPAQAGSAEDDYRISMKCGVYFGFMNLVEPGKHKANEMLFLTRMVDQGEALGKSDEEIRQDAAAYRHQFAAAVQSNKIRNDTKTHRDYYEFCINQL